MKQSIEFHRKPQLHNGWINGILFLAKFFEFIKNDKTMLEREPLEKAVKMGELMAYHHHGFWQCMDTKRDQELLDLYG